jgi:hypothetical protein
LLRGATDRNSRRPPHYSNTGPSFEGRGSPQEDGTTILLEPSPKEYIERGRFLQPDRSDAPAWMHPVIADGRLYLRDKDVLFSYDVKAK